MSIGEKIREARKRQGLSMAELGQRLGITAATVSRYELGQRQINIETLRRIAAALGMYWDELIPEDERAERIVAEVIKGAGLTLVSRKPATPQERISAALERLTPEGQLAAAERIEELADLSKYAKGESNP